MRGRYILDNVLTTQVIRSYNKEGFVVFLDWEKAFDKVDRNFILNCMSKLGFCQPVVSMIEELLGGDSFLLINGFLSESIRCANGVRQGCPLSVILYLFAVEPLAASIRAGSRVQGLKLSQSKSQKLSQYADDMTLYVRSVQCLQICLSHIDAFNLACGSKINLDKCLTLPIDCTFSGSDVGGIKTIYEDHREKYLGIFLQRSRKSSSLIEPILKYSQSLQAWKGVHLSLLGKATVVCSYALPKLLYATNLERPSLPQLVGLENLTN